jgi:hypothetical protein
MDSLTLLERSYRKSRHTVDGEWEDKFRWCFGGDGGGGGGDGDGVDEGEPTSQDAQDEADAAAAAAAAQSDAGRAGFEGWGLSGLPGPGEEEDSYGYTGVPDYETGRVDPAGILDSEANFSETFGRTPAEAVAELADPSILGLVMSPFTSGLTAAMGLSGLTGIAASTAMSTAASEAANRSGLTGEVEGLTGVNITGPIGGQMGLYARGGPVRLQDGIGSLYGKR